MVERIFEWLARALAIAGGLLVVAITIVTTYSIVGRWLFGSPLLGDTEVVEYGMAVVVAFFLPICQWRGENIIVDFFTTRASPAVQAWLDALGALVLGCTMAAVAWRTGVGLVDMRAAGQTSTIIGVPTWYTYAGMLPGLVLSAVAGFACAHEQVRKALA